MNSNGAKTAKQPLGWRERLKITLVTVCCVVLVIVAVPFVYVAGMIAYELNCQHVSPIAFDQQQWLHPEHSGERQWMLNDLSNKHKLIGMTKKELQALLGDGDSGPLAGYEGFSGDASGCSGVTYSIGTYGMDTIWLTFKVRDNNVVDYRMWND